MTSFQAQQEGFDEHLLKRFVSWTPSSTFVFKKHLLKNNLFINDVCFKYT